MLDSSRPALLLAAAISLAALGFADSASAETISFDEIPPANNISETLSDEYADLGVHFETTDDGAVWSGLSDGDPGGWGLEGTQGSAFVGFNGSSYSLEMQFEATVSDYRLDVARSAGSSPGDAFALLGLRDGEIVEEVSVELGPANEWTTVELVESVDSVVWEGVGVTSWHPFGVDHVRWEPEALEPQPLEASVDVRPFSRSNFVNPFSRGLVLVALMGEDELDVGDVDAATLRFGPGAAPPLELPGSRRGKSRLSLRWDVDHDGQKDLLALFRIPKTGIAFGDTEACLAAETQEGQPVDGCDEIETQSFWLIWLLGLFGHH